ncbi:MAG: hypothetical protein QF393_08310, partial [Rhodospirillales bacterium]|nr:hypothetical protein [Rhodospirillales bacterium]
RGQPTIGATCRHLRIFIDVKSAMTRIPFNLLGACQSSAPLSWEAKWRIWFQKEGATRDKFLYLRCPLMVARAGNGKIGRILGQMWTLGGPLSRKRKNPPERVSSSYLFLL